MFSVGVCGEMWVWFLVIKIMTSIEWYCLWIECSDKVLIFTGVLRGWWTVNRLVLMCYFFIKYGVFGWVRESAWFIRDWGDFGR